MLFPGDSGLECPVVNVYLSKYEAMLGMLEAQHVSPSLQCQVLQRLFRAFTTHVVNGLLDAHNKHLCDAIGGMDLQVVLSTIDGWCQEHAPKSAFFEKAKKELCPLKDISNILLRGRAIRAVPVLGLNYAQLERFANFYNNNVKPEDRIERDDLRQVRMNRKSTKMLRTGSQHISMKPDVEDEVDFEADLGKIALSSIPIPTRIKMIEGLRFLAREDPDHSKLIL
mmetsp:Transcript_31108/g.60051  ORF Transcript_31108/g.60051 Transcript_31108/m.60051 type:complete len:225 (-) Transcript_31108:238-912(-)